MSEYLDHKIKLINPLWPITEFLQTRNVYIFLEHIISSSNEHEVAINNSKGIQRRGEHQHTEDDKEDSEPLRRLLRRDNVTISHGGHGDDGEIAGGDEGPVLIGRINDDPENETGENRGNRDRSTI